MTALSEQELIERCRLGDELAFRALVDQYKRLVFALLSRSVDDQARVEELAQDVFLRVHRGLPYFRGDSRLATWIYRIVSNRISEERAKHRPPAVSLDAPGREGDGERAPLQLGTRDRAFGDLELRDRLEKAIRRLPLNYQVLVNGHYLDGLRYEDLAEALDLPMGTVKTHLHRAKRELRRLLEGEYR